MAVDPYGRRQSDPQHKQNLVPQNPRLWAMLQNEARQRFEAYPSIPASKWIHNEYVKRGGIFVDSKKKDTRHDKSGRETKQGEREREAEERSKKGQGKKRK
jgi:hypothetical protein